MTGLEEVANGSYPMEMHSTERSPAERYRLHSIAIGGIGDTRQRRRNLLTAAAVTYSVLHLGLKSPQGDSGTYMY